MNHNKEKNRFEEKLQNELAIIEYNLNNNIFDLYHTEVPEALQGKGIATKLVREVLGYLKKQGYKVKPSCPFIADYIAENTEFERLVV